MTKIQMINMAIDLSYIQGRIFDKEGAMNDCQDLLSNAIDTLVEEVVPQETPKDHDGCEGCHYFYKGPKDSPCNKCRQNYQDEYTLSFRFQEEVEK